MADFRKEKKSKNIENAPPVPTSWDKSDRQGRLHKGDKYSSPMKDYGVDDEEIQIILNDMQKKYGRKN
jgi:hypothetical protein